MLTERWPRVCLMVIIVWVASGLVASADAERSDSCHTAAVPGGLLAHSNLFAWGVSVDSQFQSPEALARMLERVGLKKVAYGGETKDVASFDEQIEAFKRHGIEITAWSITDVDDPTQVADWKRWKLQDAVVLGGDRQPSPDAISFEALLTMFRRHQIAPQIWLIRRMRALKPMSKSSRPISEWTDEDKNRVFRAYLGYDPVVTPEDQMLRVTQEADRIKILAEIAAPFGVKIGIYKHGGWIGNTNNEVAIMKRLETLGVRNVGIVYQFIHAHDEVDDASRFLQVWKTIEPYVLAVNVTGVHKGRDVIYPVLYPGQGDLELEMIRVIQNSGWMGPIGLSPEKGGDAELNLRNNIIGVDWIATTLFCPRSEGAPAFLN